MYGRPSIAGSPDGPESGRSAPETIAGVPVSVLVVDDEPHSRREICRAITHDERLRLAGVAEGVARATEFARTRRPMVIVTEVRMRGVTGTALLERLRCDAPSARLVVASSSSRPHDVLSVMSAGACGYLVKPSGSEDIEVVPAILAAARGQFWLSPLVARTLVDELLRSLGQQPAADAGSPPPLTPRERSVLLLLSRGMTNREIASALRIGETTVKTHVGNIIVKLNVRNRLEAVTVALQLGVIGTPAERTVGAATAA